MKTNELASSFMNNRNECASFVMTKFYPFFKDRKDEESKTDVLRMIVYKSDLN